MQVTVEPLPLCKPGPKGSKFTPSQSWVSFSQFTSHDDFTGYANLSSQGCHVLQRSIYALMTLSEGPEQDSPGMGRVRASKQSFLVACHPQSENMVSGLLLLAMPSLPVPFELLTRLCLVISSSECAHACFLLSLSLWGSTFSQCLLLVPPSLDASCCVFRVSYWA